MIQSQVDGGQRAGATSEELAVTDAHVVDTVRDIAWTIKVDRDGAGVRKLAPEGLYGRRMMTAYLRRTAMPEASCGGRPRS